MVYACHFREHDYKVFCTEMSGYWHELNCRFPACATKEQAPNTAAPATAGTGADRQRDLDAFVMSATSETNAKSFREWAGGGRVTLAIVFTDVVGSTALGKTIGDEAMNEVRRAHFAQSRKLIGQFKGRQIKTMGDSFMAAFKFADAALDYAIALQRNTGHPQVQIRVGVHIGSMQVEEGDVFGRTVDFAARVIAAIERAEIWLSDRAKEDIDGLAAENHKHLRWTRHDGVEMKGFPGKFRLWSVQNEAKPPELKPAACPPKPGAVTAPALSFDVFLSHNSKDKPAVRDLKKRLMQFGLAVWLDEDELRPGIPWQQKIEEGIRSSASVAVLVGKDGLGPWEDEEMQCALRLAVKNKRPVIPVLLPGAPSMPELPMFLSNRPWVDGRCGLTPEVLEKLVWGITGKKPAS